MIVRGIDDICRAYPRERGGTILCLGRLHFVEGLSPRARGNPSMAHAGSASARPIPASAGEPPERGGIVHCREAYPRERGGTFRPVNQHAWWRGLSPRARGNHGQDILHALADGPIPASAGEPPRGAILTKIAGAYPRERGGTPMSRVDRGQAQGLSPRARGNLSFGSPWRRRRGPIPASAGEPRYGGTGCIR